MLSALWAAVAIGGDFWVFKLTLKSSKVIYFFTAVAAKTEMTRWDHWMGGIHKYCQCHKSTTLRSKCTSGLSLLPRLNLQQTLHKGLLCSLSYYSTWTVVPLLVSWCSERGGGLSCRRFPFPLNTLILLIASFFLSSTGPPPQVQQCVSLYLHKAPKRPDKPISKGKTKMQIKNIAIICSLSIFKNVINLVICL